MNLSKRDNSFKNIIQLTLKIVNLKIVGAVGSSSALYTAPWPDFMFSLLPPVIFTTQTETIHAVWHLQIWQEETAVISETETLTIRCIYGNHQVSVLQYCRQEVVRKLHKRVWHKVCRGE